ncbi:hypothetical protein JR316_0003130 [Psilocybe cubensis]|uniref:Senescence domain-containing protein n=2 Tax=Psilocybe cubensis TaxID=181762 RepID=A0A8H7Y4L5_PSICU|nr:hypothetical protein JR316_0003130 [Psilocybe cubensis]KAH9483660.1 hypothetical protein JR316_0003130 [Psilocybe cubensis]
MHNHAPEAFMLLSLPDASLSWTGARTEHGDLYLESVSMPNYDSKDSNDRTVYLVLKVNANEAPIDPASTVRRTDGPGGAHLRSYTLLPAQPSGEQPEMTLTINMQRYSGNHELMDKLEAFENILEQYVAVYHPGPSPVAGWGSGPSGAPATIAGQSTRVDLKGGNNNDFRGQLVMVNEDTGEVVGAVEDRFRIREDPVMHQKGHENDPVIIEVGDEDPVASDANALEAFARTVPPEQRNWITSSANIASHAISMGTNLLITTITTASSFYINHSAPSPHHTASPKSLSPSTSGSGSGASTPASAGGKPPPVPPRALTFLTSEKTRKNLATVHAYSGTAVKVSAQTVGLIDKMIRRAIGANPKREKYFANVGQQQQQGGGSSASLGLNVPQNGSSAPNTRSPSPGPSSSSLHAPPPYAPRLHKSASFSNDRDTPSSSKSGPPLPPRRSPSPMPMPSPQHQYQSPGTRSPASYAPSPAPSGGPPPIPPRLSTKDHILISADLILSTIDHSTRRVLDTGTEQLGRVVGHKYGPEAAQSSLLMAGTARNVGLVYVDMRGIGRRALLKRAGKTYVKSKVSSNKGKSAAVPVASSQSLPVPQTYAKK